MPGALTVDPATPDHNQWQPFDKSCTAPQLLAHLRQALHLAATPSNAGPAPQLADFAWMANKTALLLGDAISREHVDNFCGLLGEESEVIKPGHRFSPNPATARAAVKAQHALQRPERLASRAIRVVKDTARPRMCYIPALDFLVCACHTPAT